MKTLIFKTIASFYIIMAKWKTSNNKGRLKEFLSYLLFVKEISLRCLPRYKGKIKHLSIYQCLIFKGCSNKFKQALLSGTQMYSVMSVPLFEEK